MIEFRKNAMGIGGDLLAIMAWVGAWGVAEITIDAISQQPRTRLMIYAALYFLSVIIYLFLGSHITYV